MRWVARLTIEDSEKWRNWFAWYPVRVGVHRVWFETIEKKGRYLGMNMWTWEFRSLKEKTND